MASVGIADCAGFRMRYARCGNGKETLVILPGMSVQSVAASGDVVDTACREFISRFTVYLFDRREEIPEGHSIADMAEDTVKAMEALKIEKAAFFGASQGGTIALAIAEKYPAKVSALALGSTLAKRNGTFSSVMDKWSVLAGQEDSRKLTEDVIRTIYSENTLAQYHDILLGNIPTYTETEFRNFRRMAEAYAPSVFSSHDIYGDLNRISCPVLLIGCRGDRVTTADGVREIAEALGDRCEFYFYGENYGHAVYDEAPGYRDRIAAFLERKLFRTDPPARGE